MANDFSFYFLIYKFSSLFFKKDENIKIHVNFKTLKLHFIENIIVEKWE